MHETQLFKAVLEAYLSHHTHFNWQTITV